MFLIANTYKFGDRAQHVKHNVVNTTTKKEKTKKFLKNLCDCREILHIFPLDCSRDRMIEGIQQRGACPSEVVQTRENSFIAVREY